MAGESDENLEAQFPPFGEKGEISAQNPERSTSAEKTPEAPAAGDSDDRAETAAESGQQKKRPEAYVLCRFVFVRGMALIFFIAFLSLSLQIDGLFGKNGILPIASLMNSLTALDSHPGLSQVLDFPAVFWWSASDSFIKTCCYLGMFFSGLAMAGIFCGPSLLLSWVLYLSFLTAGQDFMSFQWDILLLESGILAAVWAPWAMASAPLRLVKGGDGPPSKIVLWLLRWLLFRLMFMSGMCKLMSGDEAWSGLTALAYHYETQPLPTPPAWFFHALPIWFQQLSCLMMFGIEIVSPFLIFGNVITRRIAFGALVGLQGLILFTGNYTFFNLLSIVLCFTLIDDSLWARVLPSSLKTDLETAALAAEKRWFSVQGMQRILAVPIISIICLTNVSVLGLRTAGISLLPAPLTELVAAFYRMHLVNGYGLFAVMTQKRIEIIIEGSNDGKEWLPYEFAFKPGDLKRPPPVVAPLQPRLDWQMWFAALGTLEDNPWFSAFVQRILEGDKEVTALLAKNPFPDKPPKYLRAESYQYHFTDAGELFSTGNWWKRAYVGEYMPPVSLK